MGKLVRDKIPDLIAESDRTPQITILDPLAYRAALVDKLDEEARELRRAQTPEAVIEESADVLEVLIALAAWHGITLDTIVGAAHRKRAERGGFGRRVWLEGAG